MAAVTDKDNPDRIAQMLTGKNVFITGGTGFLGKVLVEKILRVIPDVGNIYLLIRVKKGKDPKQRIDEIFNSALFEKLRTSRPEAARQLVPICGDVTSAELGISDEDRATLIEHVHFVFHCAATIRFDEPLKKAVLLNTRGTKYVLQLAEQMKQLLCMVHVSTAYCHLEEALLREQFYPPPDDPHKIIKCVELMEESVVESMTQRILKSAPNTYAYTKALAEGLVMEKKDTLPIIIARPSIVIPIWREPVPGWTDNINGPTGLLIGAGKGVIRTMWCRDSGYADFLPVDIAVNALLLAAWNFHERGEREQKVYHLTSSSEYKVTWKEIIDLGRKITERVPLNGVVWYPGGSMKNSKTVHLIAKFFFHTLPAYFLDAIIYMAGHKPLMVRIQDRISKGMEVFEYYANNQWDFCNDQIIHLRTVLNPVEFKRYVISGEGLDLQEYFESCTHAARIYILKEMPDTLPAAHRHIRRMWWVDKLFKLFLVFMLFYMVTSYSSTARHVVNSSWEMARGFVPPMIMGSEST